MPHFLIKKEEIKKDYIELIDNENLFHLIKVLRVKVGQKVKFIDSDKNLYFCEITDANISFVVVLPELPVTATVIGLISFL